MKTGSFSKCERVDKKHQTASYVKLHSLLLTSKEAKEANNGRISNLSRPKVGNYNIFAATKLFDSNLDVSKSV